MNTGICFKAIVGSILLALIFTGCMSPPSPSKIEHEGIELYVDGKTSVSAYFQTHHLMVAAILPGLDEKEGLYTAVYPSLNFGTSPLYTHQIRIVIPTNVPIKLDQILGKDRVAILKNSNNDDIWELIGTGPPHDRNSEALDWFVDKPHLLYQPKQN